MERDESKMCRVKKERTSRLIISVVLIISMFALMAGGFAPTASADAKIEVSGKYGSNGKFLAPISEPIPDSIPIYTAQDLASIGGDYLGYSFVLMNDIDISEYIEGSWTPIGS